MRRNEPTQCSCTKLCVEVDELGPWFITVGLIFVVLAIISIGYDNIALNKVSSWESENTATSCLTSQIS